MRGTDDTAMEPQVNVPRSIFSAVLPLCLMVAGCGNTCYVGFWNGNGGGVAVSNLSCPLAKATGTVSLEMSVASPPSAAAAGIPSSLASSRDIQHIFVTLRGMEAHSGRVVNNDSSDWQELAPQLVVHPAQLDLLTLNGDFRSPGLPANTIASTTVPADEYRQLRLQIVPRKPSPNDPVPESNACDNVGWNCIVFADRSVRPLEFAGEAEFAITLDHGTDTVFRVLPDEVVHLAIEFDPASSVFFVSNVAVRLLPTFRVVSRTSPPAASAQ